MARAKQTSRSYELKPYKPEQSLGFFIIEKCNGVETWRSANYATIEACEKRQAQRIETVERMKRMAADLLAKPFTQSWHWQKAARFEDLQ